MKRSKGQWFIIAAVMIVSVLFSIYTIYRGYYEVDSSIVQSLDSTYLMRDIENQSKNIFDNYKSEECGVIRDKIDTFKRFVEKTAIESGNSISYSYDISRGCISTDFDIEIKTRDSRVSKSFTLDTQHTEFDWDLDTTAEFNGFEENVNMDTSDDELKLVSGQNSGRATYYFDPGQRYIWYKNNNSHSSNGGTVKVYWWFNETPCPDSPSFCRVDSFDQLPEEFRWIKQTIEMVRASDGSTPVMDFSSTVYATRP